MALSFYAFPGICYNPSKPGIQIVPVSILLNCVKFTETFLRGSLCNDLIAETAMIIEKKYSQCSTSATSQLFKPIFLLLSE